MCHFVRHFGIRNFRTFIKPPCSFFFIQLCSAFTVCICPEELFLQCVAKSKTVFLSGAVRSGFALFAYAILSDTLVYRNFRKFIVPPCYFFFIQLCWAFNYCLHMIYFNNVWLKVKLCFSFIDHAKTLLQYKIITNLS